jgi:tetraacyldisaccharide 4'-kinase
MPSVTELLSRIWYGNSPLRWVLWPVSLVYLALARLRRTAYRRGWRATKEPPVPVIVVGNVSVGGTGKTPFVIWLADQLKQRGRSVGIVTRG